MGELPLRDVGQHMLEALEQVLAAGLDRRSDHLRVGQREIGRAHRVDERSGGEAQLLALLARRRPRSHRRRRAAGPRSANSSGGSCRTADCPPCAAPRSACRGRLGARVAGVGLVARARAARSQALGPQLCCSRELVADRHACPRPSAPAVPSAVSGAVADRSATCSIIICCARPITQVQCCMSSRLGNAICGRVSAMHLRHCGRHCVDHARNLSETRLASHARRSAIRPQVPCSTLRKSQ